MSETCTCEFILGQDIEAELNFVGVSIFSGNSFCKCPKCGFIFRVTNRRGISK